MDIKYLRYGTSNYCVKELVNTFRPAKETYVDQGKDGKTNTHKEGTNRELLTHCC